MVVQQGQNLMDMAIEHCGDATALFDLAVINGLSATQEVNAGLDLVVPGVINAAVKNYLSSQKTSHQKAAVATNNDANRFARPTGIDYWIIETDFIVS